MKESALQKKPFVVEAPSAAELAEVLQIQRQHWKPVAREMHRRWPDVWPSPSELDDAGFYGSLVASFGHDPEGTRQVLWEVASAKRSPNWERLLHLPRGAYSNGLRLLRTLDPEQADDTKTDFSVVGIPNACRAVADALAPLGRPAYARVQDWLSALYPELRTDTADAHDSDGADVASAFASGPSVSAESAWHALVGDLEAAVEEARTEPFATAALDAATIALDELRALAAVEQEAMVEQLRDALARAVAALGQVRGAWPEPAPALDRMLTETDVRLNDLPDGISAAELDAVAADLEAKAADATHARARFREAKSALLAAIEADRDTETESLMAEKQRAQATLDDAEAAIINALSRFTGREAATGSPAGSGAEELVSAPTTGGDVTVVADATAPCVPDMPDAVPEQPVAAPRPVVARRFDSGAAESEPVPTQSDATAQSESADSVVGSGPAGPQPRSDNAGSASIRTPPAEPDRVKPARSGTVGTDHPDADEVAGEFSEPASAFRSVGSDSGLQDEALFVFESFCANRWIGPDGDCQRAPWLDNDFDDRLRAASIRALGGKRLAHLEVFSRALESRAHLPLVAADDVRAMAELLVQPGSENAGGADEPRLARLLEAAKAGAGREHVLIGVLLETLRPSDEAPPTDADRQTLLDAADISSPDLRTLLERLLIFRQHGDHAWGKLLKRYQGDETLTDAEVSAKLRLARERFQRRVTQLWSAAAGKIQRTHCRKAWTEFVEGHVSPLLPILAPGDDIEDFLRWEIGKLGNQVRKLPIRHARIADRGEAKHEDRKAMDKAAAEIADMAAEVLRLAQLHGKRGFPPTFHGLELPLPALRALLTGEPLADAAEELCRRGVVALATREPELEVTGITEADRWRFPGLLPMLESDGDPATRRWAKVLPVSAINPTNIVGAAALLLHTGDRATPAGDMPHALRSRLVETGRSDLLPYLVGSGEFDNAEKTRIQRALTERVEALNQHLRTLEGLRRDATALALPWAGDVEQAYEDARRLLEDRERVYRELPLLASWLHTLIKRLRDEVDRNRESLRSEAEGIEDPEQQAAVLAEMEAGRFDRALEGLRDKQAVARGDGEALRQTTWRRHARLRFPEPLSTLQAAAQGAELGELPALWLRQRGSAEAQAATKLRRVFYDFVSGEGDLSPTRKRRIVPRELREIRGSQIVVNCAELLKLLAKEGMNPSFVPQLRDFSELVIASPPAGITPTKAPNQLSRYVAEERDSRKLVVFLMPGLPEPARERILAELRGRELRSAGAVLDDLDLCRLIGQDTAQRPHGMLGLIELVFEQLSWKDLSPYVSRDGQFIQLEMFVGREREAEKLALSAEYTRIFSGRKLGKSALLKYVEQTYSGTRLPSGNELQVVYIIVAGGDSENWLTDKILAEIGARFADAPQAPDKADPGDRLEIFLETFFQQHSGVSLLVILDEADAFVEGQLKEYDRVRERCLSFRMMKTTFGGVDQNNLPRIRFVFSGYRVTNSRAGAWANAGSILRLAPLKEDEAVKLAVGPLARLGINASEQAMTIARYSGFQPAIIIRFCDALLKHVQLTYAATGRREVTISYEDVVNTFHQGGVQEEIRTINDNNFQGNRVGRIVFWTMLLAFNDLLSGQGLEDAPTELLSRLRGIDPDTAWLRKLDPSETGEIQRNLHDFRDRELIEQSQQAGGPVYRMKFPAHLPVLMTEEDPEHQIRQDIQRVRDGGHEAHFVTSLLTPKQIDDLHFALSGEGAEMGIAMAVACSSWPGALQDDRGGVVDRLGHRGAAVVDGSDAGAVQADCELLLVHNAVAALAERLAAARDPALPPPLLIGGLDLMRWALQHSVAGQDAMVAYAGLKRVDEARLTWWYERLRNTHFETQDAIARILALTSGVPLLLRAWENLMPAHAEIGRAQFEALCDAFVQQLPQVAEGLTSSNPALGLTERERELLRMAARVGLESDGRFQLREHLADDWDTWAELLGGDIADAPPLYAVDGDAVAVDLLTETGFIPVNGRGEVIFQTDDVMFRLFCGAA